MRSVTCWTKCAPEHHRDTVFCITVLFHFPVHTNNTNNKFTLRQTVFERLLAVLVVAVGIASTVRAGTEADPLENSIGISECHARAGS